jgi:hypothetical protein
MRMRGEFNDPLDIGVYEMDKDKVCVLLPIMSRMFLKNVNCLGFLAHNSEIPPARIA